MSKQEILLTDSAVDFLKEEVGGGEGIEYVELDYHSTTITQEQATALQNGALIKAINHNKYFVMIPSSLKGEYCTGADRAREGKVYIRHCKIDFTNLTVTWDDFELQLEGGGSDVEYITVSIDGGTLTAEQLAKVFHNGFVKKGVFFRIDNIILVSSGHPREQVFNSTVINGKYYSMEVDEFTGVYTITEVSVGGGSELGDAITIDSTNFEPYDTYFETSIGGGLYRVGIIFKNKTTNEKYCIVCNTETNFEEIDWDDPNIFNICMGCVRGGDLVLKEGGSYFTKIGVVCQYTDSSSTTTKIQILN